MKGYPRCYSEEETVRLALGGRNLARYGDGEFSIIRGGNCTSQLGTPELAKELLDTLQSKNSRTLPCLPTPFGGTPRKDNWLKFATPGWISHFDKRTYGSAFITRPDSAPWIDTMEYWSLVRQFWVNKDVTLVLGSQRSLRPDAMLEEGAKSVREIWGPRRDAYAELNRIEEQIGSPNHSILLCLGPAATVLADRLAKKDLHAVDLGHLGMFMRHAGGYKYKLEDLATSEYRNLLGIMHISNPSWGDDGWRQAEEVLAFSSLLNAVVILDYGCGKETLGKAIGKKLRVWGYDPGIPEKSGMPKPVDVVVCTDVLEHVEISKLSNVLDHIFSLAGSGVYIHVSTRLANEVLPNGKNAHQIVQPPEWWRDKIQRAGWCLVTNMLSVDVKRQTATFCLIKEGKNFNHKGDPVPELPQGLVTV